MFVCVCMHAGVRVCTGGTQHFPSSPAFPPLPSPAGAQALCQGPPKATGDQGGRAAQDCSVWGPESL